MSSGVDRVLQALAHLPELTRHRLAVVEVPAVARFDLGCLDVHAALVGVRGREDVALVHEPLERLRRRHVPRSYSTLCQKRAYKRCSTACSTPPT